MANICINTINAEGTPKQINEFIQQVSGVFGNDPDINDNFETGGKSYASLTLCSSWAAPKKELLEVTNSLPDTQALYIRMISEEPGEEYHEQFIFRDGKWSFENPSSINEQILALKKLGVEKIRKHLKENGKLYTINEDDFWIALYVNNAGDGTSSLMHSIKLEDDETVSVNLEDGNSLYENELTANHVMDILTIIEEGHGGTTASARIQGEGNDDCVWLQCADKASASYGKEFYIPSSELQNVKSRWIDEGTEDERFQIFLERKASGDSYWCNAQSIDFE